MLPLTFEVVSEFAEVGQHDAHRLQLHDSLWFPSQASILRGPGRIGGLEAPIPVLLIKGNILRLYARQ